MFSLTIDTGNAAFEDRGTNAELALILHELAFRLDRTPDSGSADRIKGKIRDSNGNTVGHWSLD